MLKPLRAALWVCLAVVATLFGLRGLGALQPLELAAYDRLLSRVERPNAVSTRIALIEISELDIQELGHWPPTDLEISMLIESILDAGANAVGLDIYRDLPVAPGQEDFEHLHRGNEVRARVPELLLPCAQGTKPTRPPSLEEGVRSV